MSEVVEDDNGRELPEMGIHFKFFDIVEERVVVTFLDLSIFSVVLLSSIQLINIQHL